MDDNSNIDNNENDSDKLPRKEEDFSTLISRAIELYKDDKLLEASRVLSSSDDIRNIIDVESEGTWNDLNRHEKVPKQEKNPRDENTRGKRATAFLTEHEILHEILQKSLIANELIQKSESHKLKGNYVDKKDQDWIETGIYYNPFASEMSYRLVETPLTNSTDPSRTTKSSLECQCVTVIPVSLLQSLLVVLNETELYTQWIPSFTFPKFGIHSLTKLHQCGRVGQELSIVMNVPWPLKQRAVRRLKVWVFDDIDHQNVIGIKIQNEPCSNDDGSTSTSSSNSNNVGESVVDIAVDGGFLIRPCPKDHPLYIASTLASLKQKKHSSGSQEDQILITFNASVDPQISIIPPSVFNFFTKVAFKQCWKMLLQIAVDVQNNKRLDHQKAIQEKKELYNWIEKRLQVLFADSSEEKDATVEARHKKREVENYFTTSTAAMITDPAKMMI